MPDELIDIVDKNNKKTGRKKLKSEAHKNGWSHRSVHVCIYNSKGELMLQLRAKNKVVFPDVWDISAAGHVGAGEKPPISALREVEEEVGLKIKKTDLEFFKILKEKLNYKDIINNEFYYIYFLKFDGDIKKLKLQKSEVQKIKFFSPEELKKELEKKSNKIIPHQQKYWNGITKEIKKLTKKS